MCLKLWTKNDSLADDPVRDLKNAFPMQLVVAQITDHLQSIEGVEFYRLLKWIWTQNISKQD